MVAHQPAPEARAAPTRGADRQPGGHEPRHEAQPPSDGPVAASGEWPEPDAASSGGTGSPDNKRKRRRRKGKGQSPQSHALSNANEEGPAHDDAAEPALAAAPTGGAPRPAPAAQPPLPQRQPTPRGKVDPETLARKAWKIFLAEVSEEGVALISDQDARELARRCFRLAETFIEEQSRRLPNSP